MHCNVQDISHRLLQIKSQSISEYIGEAGFTFCVAFWKLDQDIVGVGDLSNDLSLRSEDHAVILLRDKALDCHARLLQK